MKLYLRRDLTKTGLIVVAYLDEDATKPYRYWLAGSALMPEHGCAKVEIPYLDNFKECWDCVWLADFGAVPEQAAA